MSVLEERYASTAMKEIWSKESKIRLERELWIAVMKAQIDVGLNIDRDAIRAYESVINKIDLDSINAREKITRHDVKARIEEFNHLAGFEYIHIGMTSRDITENIELVQIFKALNLTAKKVRSFLHLLSIRAEEFKEVAMVGRTHNVPAQVTTLGRKIANWAEELLFSYSHLMELIMRLPLKGVKGAIGTSSDLIELVGENFEQIDERIMEFLGFETKLLAPSQIYPRSIDLEVVATLNQVAATPSNVAVNIRLMSGLGLLSERLEKGQTGSSAMPHKVNPRLSERVNSLAIALKGYLTMVNELSGNQWNEGDVSCSAVRRIALTDSFYAIDAILDTCIYVLDSIDIDKEAIASELEAQLPVMLSSRILSLAVKSGLGREVAHERIKEHARLAGPQKGFNKGEAFLQRILDDPILKINAQDIREMQSNPISLAGAASTQTLSIVEKIKEVISSFPNEKREISSFVI